MVLSPLQQMSLIGTTPYPHTTGELLRVIEDAKVPFAGRGKDFRSREDFVLYVQDVCEFYGRQEGKYLDPALVLALIMKESGCKADAKSRSGRYQGLLQLSADVAKSGGINPGQRQDPRAAVYAGVSHLLRLSSAKSDDLNRILLAYKFGVNGSRHLSKTQVEEGDKYIQRITKYMNRAGVSEKANLPKNIYPEPEWVAAGAKTSEDPQHALFPVPGGEVRDGFGERRPVYRHHKLLGYRRHKGVDVAGSLGGLVNSVFPEGKVVFVGKAKGLGPQTVIIESSEVDANGNALYAIFGHNSKAHVKIGDAVKAGEHIADVGSAGGLAHVHIQVHKGPPGLSGKLAFKLATPIDPESVWKRA